jgi:hypothetical protein
MMAADQPKSPKLTVTLDTTVVNERDEERLREACAGRPVEIVHTTVTDREHGTHKSGRFATKKGELMETAVWGESSWGQAVWAGKEDSAQFKKIINIITNGSFSSPGDGGSLSEGQRSQLRDAMILQAHARDGRDVSVSNDERAFIRHGRREKLEALCSTLIVTLEEFISFVREAR